MLSNAYIRSPSPPRTNVAFRPDPLHSLRNLGAASNMSFNGLFSENIYFVMVRIYSEASFAQPLDFWIVFTIINTPKYFDRIKVASYVFNFVVGLF